MPNRTLVIESFALFLVKLIKNGPTVQRFASWALEIEKVSHGGNGGDGRKKTFIGHNFIYLLHILS